MKAIKKVLVILVILGGLYLFIDYATGRVERINSGEMEVVNHNAR